MFWCAWRLEPLTDDPEEQRAIFTDAYWSPELDGRTAYRSREYGAASPTAFPSGVRDGRLVMRGLHQPVSCRPWDRLALRLCRRLERTI
jgi:hypothetical protein